MRPPLQNRLNQRVIRPAPAGRTAHGNNGKGALLPPLHIVGVEHNLCPHAPLPT
jgi:hypothetical protein